MAAAVENAGTRSSDTTHVINGGVDHSNNNNNNTVNHTDAMHNNSISNGNSDQKGVHGKVTHHHLQHQHQNQNHHLVKPAIQHMGHGSVVGVDSNGNGDGGGGVQNFHMGGFDRRENGSGGGDDGGEGFKRDIRDLEELLSKLNPMAEEFVPPSLVNGNKNYFGLFNGGGGGFGYANNFVMQTDSGNGNGLMARRKKSNYGQGRRRMNSRTSLAQREEVIRRTVYVCDIDQQVTEEQLAALFLNCGQVVDCRVCGDPNSVLRFAFVEFTDEEGARAALSLSGTMLGFYPVRVLPSKTAIAPVNPTFLPRSEDEREMCARTIYCTNIDKKVSQADVKLFFESICGEVYRLRLLGDYQHSTRIAFVEFVMAESAIAALNCSGAVLGSLPLRVSPSKTPVRPRSPRPPFN